MSLPRVHTWFIHGDYVECFGWIVNRVDPGQIAPGALMTVLPNAWVASCDPKGFVAHIAIVVSLDHVQKTITLLHNR